MASATIRVPSGTLRAVGQALLPTDSSEERCLKVSIRIADHDISIRDLAAFLELIDRIYGRQDENGFRSYARREQQHVQIAKLERGCWQLDLVQILGSAPSFILIFTGIVLSNLPKLAAAYNSVQQGRLANAQRKALIQERLKEDKRLENVSEEELEKLSDSVGKLLEKDHDLVPRATRFAEDGLLGVDISDYKADEAEDSE